MNQKVSRADWWKMMRWRLARETGWALEYIDGLSLGDVQEYISINDGMTKAEKSRRQAQAGRKGRRR